MINPSLFVLLKQQTNNKFKLKDPVGVDLRLVSHFLAQCPARLLSLLQTPDVSLAFCPVDTQTLCLASALMLNVQLHGPHVCTHLRQLQDRCITFLRAWKAPVPSPRQYSLPTEGIFKGSHGLIEVGGSELPWSEGRVKGFRGLR